MLNYIRSKLSNKKIELGQKFLVVVLGIEEQFEIVEMQDAEDDAK